MKQTRILMGMPVTLEINDEQAGDPLFDEVYAYFEYIDAKFSTYKDDSEISRINRGELSVADSSDDMRTVFALADQTGRETGGYFNIERHGLYDPSGLVKGWAILNAANILRQRGCKNFYVEAGGDAQVSGSSPKGQMWRIGIRNPFNMDEIVKVLSVTDCGVATSGTYVRGQHIYNPHQPDETIPDVLSLTVIASDIYEADRFATAAFAMGRDGIFFIEDLYGFEGYLIDKDGVATFTSGFQRYVIHDEVHRQPA